MMQKGTKVRTKWKFLTRLFNKLANIKDCFQEVLLNSSYSTDLLFILWNENKLVGGKENRLTDYNTGKYIQQVKKVSVC